MRRSNRQTDILIAPATRRHKTQTCVVAVAVSLFAAMTANAQLVIFDNIPSDYQFGGGGATIRGAGANPPLASISLAQQFTPTEDTVLGSVHLGLNGSQSGNYFDVDLFSGSGNGPDTHLASLGTAFGVSFACCFPADFNSQAFILNSTAEITLQAGVEYYIVVKAQLSTSQAAWATVTDTVGHWRDVGGTGWTFHGIVGVIEIVRLSFYTSMSFLLIVVISIRIAPSNKRLSTLIAFMIGCIFVAPFTANAYWALTISAIGGVGVALYALLRWGLVTLVVAIAVNKLLVTFPLTLTSNLWYFDFTLLVGLLILGLIAWAHYYATLRLSVDRVN